MADFVKLVDCYVNLDHVSVVTVGGGSVSVVVSKDSGHIQQLAATVRPDIAKALVAVLEARSAAKVVHQP